MAAIVAHGRARSRHFFGPRSRVSLPCLLPWRHKAGTRMRERLDGITWFRGSSVRIRAHGVEVYVDPSGVRESARADVILLTHPHFDIFSEEDIERVRGHDTVVVAPASMKKQLADADHFMRPGDMLQLEGFDVLAVPAHNVGRRFHPQEE